MNAALLWGGPEHGRTVLVDVPNAPSIVAPVRADSGPFSGFVGAPYTRRLLVQGFAVYAVYVAHGQQATPVVDVLAMLHDKHIRPLEASHVALCK